MSKPKAPKPPDPAATAAAQTGTNVSTAVANQVGSMVNQRTPDGSLSYNQTGVFDWTDPSTGQAYQLPRFEAVTALDPVSAQTDAIGKQAEQNLATLGRDQSARLQGVLSEPVSLENAETERRLIDLGRQRLDPMLAQRRDAIGTQLVNQGLRPGTEAYDREMTRLNEGENDAYNSLILSGRGQAIQERLTERNQPINEITALLSGSQVSQPNFASTPGMNMPTTDYAGLVGQNYAGQMSAYNQNMQGRQQLFGGLFGAGAGLLTGAGAAGGFSNLFR